MSTTITNFEANATAPTALDQRRVAENTARQFEQIFVQQMLQAMRDSVGTGESDGLFGKGPGSGTYGDWFDLHLGRHLTDHGGIGLARVMLQDWEKRGWTPPATDEAAAPKKPGGMRHVDA